MIKFLVLLAAINAPNVKNVTIDCIKEDGRKMYMYHSPVLGATLNFEQKYIFIQKLTDDASIDIIYHIEPGESCKVTTKNGHEAPIVIFPDQIEIG